MSMQMEVEGIANKMQALKGYGFNVSAQEQEMIQIREQLRSTECTNASAEGCLAQIQARIRNTEQALDEMECQRMVQPMLGEGDLQIAVHPTLEGGRHRDHRLGQWRRDPDRD